MPSGGGKGKGKEEEPVLSYHGVGYVNLSPLLYPGGESGAERRGMGEAGGGRQRRERRGRKEMRGTRRRGESDICGEGWEDKRKELFLWL